VPRIGSYRDSTRGGSAVCVQRVPAPLQNGQDATPSRAATQARGNVPNWLKSRPHIAKGAEKVCVRGRACRIFPKGVEKRSKLL
jgi:hypothetical protein